MENYSTEAINIKSYPMSENDSIVVMFSKEKGLIRGIAKGVKRPKSKLGARMQALVANNVLLDKRRNLDIVKEASALNTFNKLRYDLDKLSLALYAVEVINTFCTDNKDEEQNKIIYDILYNTLNNLQNSKTKEGALLSIIKFQLVFMKQQGFGLEFDTCLKCSKNIKDETVLFSPQTGGITCMDCEIEPARYVKLHPKIRMFLSELNKTNVNESTKYDDLVNDKVTNGCFNLLKKYIEIISNKKSKTVKVMEETKAG